MCEYWEVRLGTMLITRGDFGHAISVQSQLRQEGISTTLHKVFPTPARKVNQ